ncbi:hypothetical protein FRC17_005062 [Serendipita sp. 399]|nr:hypothetical protein FRC17_005062 [Serendipita sp. 399]
MSSSANFYHVDAFTTQQFTGNPAGVLFLDSKDQFEDDDLLHKIAKELNMPATAFLFFKSSNDTSITYEIKWFSAIRRIPICGHGTLAASHVIFQQNPGIHLIEYDAGPAGPLQASRTVDDLVQLDFPACHLVGMNEIGETLKPDVDLNKILASALNDENVRFEYIGRGDRGGYIDMIVVELPENYPLEQATIDCDVLTKLFPVIRGVSFTTWASHDENFHIHSRCINSVPGLGEDYVTGSSHCMIAPHWLKKTGTLAGDRDLKAAQVSARRGSMLINWKEEEMRCLIRSSAVTFSTGTIALHK